jgi:RIO kinase 1
VKLPDALKSLLEDGCIDEVVRPLKSGKEASIYLVWAGGRLCAAKIYKERNERSFQNRAVYTEGRRVRNSRQQRAIDKKTRFGKAALEEEWKSAEVNMLYLLRKNGVRVPEPITFLDGVLVMALVADADGDPAPSISMLELSPQEAREVHTELLAQVVKMLCAGVIHGDLSAQNVLLGVEGPTIIDLPQAISASHNQQAQQLLLRDITSVTEHLQTMRAGLLSGRRYADEIWWLYEQGELTPEHKITGAVKKPAGPNRDERSLRKMIQEEIAASEEFTRRPERPPAVAGQRPRGGARGRARG